MNKHVSVLALSAGLLASTVSLEAVWAQVVEIQRSQDAKEVEARPDDAETSLSEQSAVERSEQDNIFDAPVGEGDVEVIIRALGAEFYDELSPEGVEPMLPSDDGVDAEIHRLADDVGKAYENKKYRQVLELVKDQDDLRLARPEVNVFEAWSSFRVGSSLAALGQFEVLYGNEPSVSNAVGVIYSGMRSERYTRTYEFAEAKGGPLKAILRPAKPHDAGSEPEKVRMNFLNGWLAAAIKYDRIQTTARVAKILQIDPSSSTNVAALNNLGWQARRQGNFDQAQRYFARVEGLAGSGSQYHRDAVFGQALILKDKGLEVEAFDYVSAHRSEDVRLQHLYRDMVLGRGYQAYDSGQYQTSLDLAQQAVAADETSRQAQLLSGWSHLRLGDAESASELFAALYRAQPDQESADGLNAALLAQGRSDEVNRIANEIGGPLAPVEPTIVASLEQPADTTDPVAVASSEPMEPTDNEAVISHPPGKAERSFYRKQFKLAAERDPNAFGVYAETAAPWVGLGARIQVRDGDKGLSRLSILSGTASYKGSSGLSHYRIEVEAAELDAGRLEDQMRPVGTFIPDGITPSPYLMTTENTVYIPRIRWRQEGDVALDASIGASALKGKVSPTVTGHFDVILHSGDAKYTLGGHRNSVFESLLSFSGIDDPQTGEAFGHVVETGVHGAAFVPLSNRFNLSSEARWGERTGQNVADNTRVSFSGGITYDLAAPNFSYLALGPNYRYESFDKNLSHFTLGHGGYYSPSSIHQFGVGAHFLTQEGKSWLIKGSLNVGYEETEKDEAPFFPLTPLASPDVYAGESSSGTAYSLQAQGAWKLTDHWIAESGAYAINADDYNEIGLFFKMRFSIGKRSGLRETDLTERLIRKYH
jgi:tetratricopeptide (TPR) repeat protein